MQICSFLKIKNCSFVFVAILDFTESQDYEIVYEECEILRFFKMQYYGALLFFFFKEKQLNTSAGKTTASHAGVFQ